MYMPAIESMNRIGGVPLGENRTALLFDNVKSVEPIQYAFILAVFDDEKQEPIYFVTSEVNMTAAEFGGGSHFLCIFNGWSHANCGASNDWGDPKKFFAKAIRIAAEHFDVPYKEE